MGAGLEVAELAGGLAGEEAAEALALLDGVAVDEAISSREEPEDAVQQVDPNCGLHGHNVDVVPVLVVLGLVLVAHVEELAGEGAEHGDPEHEQQQVPEEQLVRLPEGYGKDYGCDARDCRYEERVNPGRSLGIAISVVCCYASAVEAADDQGENQLDTPSAEA